MFGWVPSQVWAILGMATFLLWGIEFLKRYKRKKEPLYFRLSFLFMSIAGLVVMVREILNKNIVIGWASVDLLNVGFFFLTVAIVGLFYRGYKLAIDKNDRKRVEEIKLNIAKIIVIFAFMIMIYFMVK